MADRSESATPEPARDEAVRALEEQSFQALRDLDLQHARDRVANDIMRVRYRAFADRFVALFERAGAPDVAREVQRTIAFRIFGLLMDEERSVEVCEPAFAEVLALGFGSLVREAHTITVFCAYCGRHGASVNMLSRYLDPLMRKLEESGDPSWTFLSMCQDILARAAATPKPT